MTKTNPETPATTEPDDLNADHDDRIVGVAFRWSLLVILLGVGLAGSIYYVVAPSPSPPPTTSSDLSDVATRRTSPVEIPQVHFTDITNESGITFRHTSGFSDERLLPETMGGGVAFFDYNNNGHQDLLLINSCEWPWNRTDDHVPATMALYRNDGKGNFTDVTEGSGLEIECYGMGVAVADFDGDGLVDIYVTALGKNLLFRNLGDGKFEEIGEQAGVAGSEDSWSTSAGWFDYDGDGHLDLFVGNYLDWKREYDTGQDFQLVAGTRGYGRPQNFRSSFNYLFRNNGDGTFTEVAEEAGLHIHSSDSGAPMGKALGVALVDVDRDGWIDIIVANDTVQNFFFHNQGDGTFREMGNLAGIAFDDNGNARGAMGIDVAAFRNDASLGVAIGNFSNEMTALYVSNNRELLFVDEAVSTGLGPVTRLQLTFGVFFFDYDLDGRLDLFAANGHLEREINRVQSSQHYEQPPQLFWNCGSSHDSEFVPVPESKCGPDLLRPMVGRGAAYADIDGDGDLDLIIVGLDGPPRLLRNDLDSENHWLRIQLKGNAPNTGAIGARVEVTADGVFRQRQVMPTRSYLSQVELPVTFGLGETDTVQTVRIVWPDGTVQELGSLEVDQAHVIQQPTQSEEGP